MESAKLQIAKDNEKKYLVKYKGKVIQFGQFHASDYTHHGEDERRKQYIERHGNEQKFWDPSNKDNLLQPSFWSRYLLWEKKDIFEAIRNIEKMTGVQIKYSPLTIQKQQKNLSKQIKLNI